MGQKQAEPKSFPLGAFFDENHPIGSQVLVFFGPAQDTGSLVLLDWADFVLYHQDQGIEGKPLTNIKYHVKMGLHNAELAGVVLPYDVDEIMRLEQYGLPWATESSEIRQTPGEEGGEDRQP